MRDGSITTDNDKSISPDSNVSSLLEQGLSTDSDKANPVSNTSSPSPDFTTNRQKPFWPQSSLGAESTPGRDFFSRRELSWKASDINEMMEKYGLIQTSVVRKSRRMFSKGFRILIPQLENKTDSKHPFSILINKFNKKYNIFQLCSQMSVARFETGGGLLVYYYDDIKTSEDWAKEVAKDAQLLKIECYTKRELKNDGKDGLPRDSFGDVEKYLFKITKEASSTKIVPSRLGTEELEVHPDRVIFNPYNYDGAHPDGIPHGLSLINLANQFRNNSWNLDDILYNNASPFAKGFYYQGLDKDKVADFAASITHIHRKDGITIPMNQKPGDLGDVVFDRNFSDIANIGGLLEYKKSEFAGQIGMPESFIFGNSEGLGASAKVAELGWLGDLNAELVIEYTPMFYQIYDKEIRLGTLKLPPEMDWDDFYYEIDWLPLYELTPEDRAKIGYFGAQTGNLWTLQGWAFDIDVETGLIDYSTLRQVSSPMGAGDEPPLLHEEPKGYTDIPGSKSIPPDTVKVMRSEAQNFSNVSRTIFKEE